MTQAKKKRVELSLNKHCTKHRTCVRLSPHYHRASKGVVDVNRAATKTITRLQLGHLRSLKSHSKYIVGFLNIKSLLKYKGQMLIFRFVCIVTGVTQIL